VNMHTLRNRLDAREAELRALQETTPHGTVTFAREFTRISNLRRKIDAHIKFQYLARARRQFRTQLKVAHDKLVYGRAWFMSLDVERTPEGHFQEVGVTMFRGRDIESFNYRIKGVGRGPKFLYGHTMEVDFETMRNLILLHANTADVYLGHSFSADLRHLEAEGIYLPNKFYYDTALWSKAIFGFTHSLINLTREYHTAGQMFHCGGNDARYTADVFLKMVFTHYEEYYPEGSK
jgi:hypothetical protein